MVMARPCISSGPAKVPNYWECEYLYFASSMQSNSSYTRLSNEKSSAIFRLKGTGFTSGTSSVNAFSAFSQQGVQQNEVTTTLGLSIEPLSAIQSQIQLLPSAITKPGADMMGDPTLLAERIVKHLSYVSGFTGGSGMSSDVAVLMSVIAKWYESFTGKIRAGGVGFLERTLNYFREMGLASSLQLICITIFIDKITIALCGRE